MDLFKAIFADESSDVSSNESDAESTIISPHGNSSDAKLTTDQSERQWQDLSSIASHSKQTKGMTNLIPSQPSTSLSQSYENSKDSTLTEYNWPTVECYGPSLPPGT